MTAGAPFRSGAGSRHGDAGGMRSQRLGSDLDGGLVPARAAAPNTGVPAADRGGLGDLAAAVTATFAQLTHVQRRYRRALTALPAPEATGLVDTWCAFHRHLADVRYAPSVTALRSGRRLHEDAAQQAISLAASLADAYEQLREHLAEVERMPARGEPAQREPQEAVLLSRWRLLSRGEPDLRHAVHLALSGWDEGAAGAAAQLTVLAAAVADYQAADSMVATAWSGVRGPGGSGALTTMRQWLAVLYRSRELIERAVIGPVEPVPAAALPDEPVPAPVAGGPLATLRERVAELIGEYPHVVTRCRAKLRTLTADEPAVQAARGALLAAWGHYDDELTDLSQLAAAPDGRVAAHAARRLGAALTAALAGRDRLLARLAATGSSGQPG